MNQVKEYDAKLDTKRRVTLRGALFEHYHVREYEDGRIELEPRQLVTPFEISRLSLNTMDQSMKNLGEGQVSDPVDLSAFHENE